jgi:hypothetical protein
MGYRTARLAFMTIVMGLVLALSSGIGVSGALASYTQDIDGSTSINSVSCVPGKSDCVVSDSAGRALYATNVSASSEATWKAWSGPSGESPSQAVDCPTTSLCLLADGKESAGGKLYYTTSLGEAFHEAYSPSYGVDAISCISSSLCVDGQDNYGYFRYSTNPASTSWTLESQGEAAMKSVFCLPSPSTFCAIADSHGRLHIATSESQIKSSSWKETDVDGSTALNGIACVSASSCIAVDGDGDVLRLAVAGNGEATVTKSDIDGTSSLTAVTCVESTCVTVDNQGNVFVSTNGGETWNNEYQLSSKLTSVSCVSASLCLTANTAGSVTAFAPPAASGPKNTGLPAAEPLPGWSAWLEGQIFTATTGSWTGAEPISYHYQWQKCNAEGVSCSNISGATASTFKTTSEDVGGTLRVVVTATNSEGSSKVTSPAGDVIVAQAAPEAHVVNSAGETVQNYGETYAGGPGGQIELAEEYAHAHGDSKVTLASGTFRLYSSSMHNLEDLSIGIVAYSNIQLEGAGASSEILVEPLGRSEGLDVVFGVFAEPYGTPKAEYGPYAENIPGTGVDIGNFSVNAKQEANVVVDVGPERGSDISVHNITVSNAQDPTSTGAGQGIVVGEPQGWSYGGPVEGTSTSPAQITENVSENTATGGIEVTGKDVSVTSNHIYWVHTFHGSAIEVDSNSHEAGRNIQIVGNRMEDDHTGIGLDGSGEGGYSDNIQENVVIDTCVGIDLNVQTGDYVGNNVDYLEGGFNGETVKDPYNGDTGLECGSPGKLSSVGILFEDSPGNYAYGNYLDNWVRGVWLLWNGEGSNAKEKFGAGTQYNGVGVYYNQEKHEDAYDGNEILLGVYPIVDEDETHKGLANWNAIYDNKTEDSTGGCYYESLDENYIDGNTGAGCEQIS